MNVSNIASRARRLAEDRVGAWGVTHQAFRPDNPPSLPDFPISANGDLQVFQVATKLLPLCRPVTAP